MKLNPYLNFPGKTEEAFKFYRSVFGGEYTITRFKDMPMQGMKMTKDDENKVMHIILPIGSDALMASDALESHGQVLVRGNDFGLSFAPDSKAEADRVFKALSVGGMVEMPLADQMWGDYYGSVKDRFGIRWMVNYTYPKKK